MTHSDKHLNICILMNLIGLLGLFAGHIEIAAAALFSGLLKFEIYMIVRAHENKKN